MIKILLVAPYSDPKAQITQIVNAGNQKDISIEVVYILGSNLEAIKEKNADIVISRGISFTAVKKQMINVHAIEIAVTGYDILRACQECKRLYNPKSIGIIAAESMLCDINVLSETTGIHLEIFKVASNSDVYEALERVKQRKLDAVIGGLTACQLCQKEKIKHVLIETGSEAIKGTINEALNAAKVINQERTKAQLFKTVLNNSREGILAVTHEGTIIANNAETCKILGRSPSENLSGLKITQLFPARMWAEKLDSEDEFETFEKINDHFVLINRSYIKADSQSVCVLFTLQNATKIQEAEKKVRKELAQKGLVARYGFEDILGDSPEIKKAIEMATKLSSVNSNVVLTGETGTGKELFAHSIHRNSKRNNKPFVAINCAALPENLLESELFGYVEGAFSGAAKGGKIGLFELAHQGTLFMDEIGEMPVALQAKLLRVLQEKEIRKIGDDKVISVDVRIISATNKNFSQMIKEGAFREDLYYRLNILNIRIPSLRERARDIERIACSFVNKLAAEFDKPAMVMDGAAIDLLCRYSWPGNVRELRNFCEKMVVLSNSSIITSEDVAFLLPEDYLASNDEKTMSQSCDVMQYENDIDMYRRLGQKKMKKTEIAQVLGISRTTLWRRINKQNK